MGKRPILLLTPPAGRVSGGRCRCSTAATATLVVVASMGGDPSTRRVPEPEGSEARGRVGRERRRVRARTPKARSGTGCGGDGLAVPLREYQRKTSGGFPSSCSTVARRPAFRPLRVARCVSAAKPAWRKSLAPAAPSDQSAAARTAARGSASTPGRPPSTCRRSGARDELADRLRCPRSDGLLVLAVVGVALDERLAHEARHLVVGERPRGLEVAAARTTKSSAVWHCGSRSSTRPSTPAVASRPRTCP